MEKPHQFSDGLEDGVGIGFVLGDRHAMDAGSRCQSVLGQATHFVQDLNQPLHAVWGETRAEHNEIEVQMLYRTWQRDHTYRGFMLVKNYACFAHEIAQKSSQHARA